MGQRFGMALPMGSAVWCLLPEARHGAADRRHGIAGRAGGGSRRRWPAGTAPPVGSTCGNGASGRRRGSCRERYSLWAARYLAALYHACHRRRAGGGANAVGRCPPEWNDGQRTAASIDAAARRGGATPWNGAWSVPARARTPSARSGLLGDRAGTLKAAAANALRVHPGPPVAASPDILVFGH